MDKVVLTLKQLQNVKHPLESCVLSFFMYTFIDGSLPYVFLQFGYPFRIIHVTPFKYALPYKRVVLCYSFQLLKLCKLF